MNSSEKLSNAKQNFKKGLYQHYKGGEYQVLDIAIHSETEELMILYKPLYGEQNLWVRPYKLFFEKVIHSSLAIDRFAYVKPID